MATTYFGYCASNGTFTGTSAGMQYFADHELNWREANNVGDTCPGSGAMDVKSMGMQTGYTNFSVGMAVYGETGDLRCHTTTFKQGITGGIVTWTSGEITWDSGTTLTGGAAYHIAFIGHGNGSAWGGVNGAIYCQRYATGYQAFSTTLPTGTRGQEYFNVRVGVDVAGGGEPTVTHVPVIMYMDRRRRA